MRFSYYTVHTGGHEGEELARFKYLKNACKFMLEHKQLHSCIGDAEVSMVCHVDILPRDVIHKLYPSETFKD